MTTDKKLIDIAVNETAKDIRKRLEAKIMRKSYRLSCVNEDLEGEVIDISELNKILDSVFIEFGV